MSQGKPPPRSTAGHDKSALQAGIERLARIVKDLRAFDLSGIKDRSDSRLEFLQRKANTALSDIVGHSSPEYKKHSITRFDTFLDTTFGAHHSPEEFREAMQKGIDQAASNFTAVRKLLEERLESGAPAENEPEAAPPATAAPTPAPTKAPAPAPTKPPPQPTAAPTPAPTPAPTAAPTPAPTSRPIAPPTPSAPPATPTPTPKNMNKPTTASSPATEANTRRVLVLGVSGDTAVQTIEFLEDMGLEPAILDTPSVDKLDALRDTTFAIVLPSDDANDPSMLVAVGFMLAAVGRSRICLLAPATQALSPALEGALRIAPDDSGVWRLLLAREMKRAGLEVDLNRAL